MVMAVEFTYVVVYVARSTISVGLIHAVNYLVTFKVGIASGISVVDTVLYPSVKLYLLY